MDESDRIVRRMVMIVIGICALLIAGSTVLSSINGDSSIVHLLFGWGDFIRRVAGEMQFRWEVIWSVALYALILIVGGHYFLRWLYHSIGGGRWKWGWTVRGFAVFVIMFVAGTSAVALVEQTKWLASSDRSMRSPSCPSKLRQLGQWLLLYAIDHDGKYPDDLAELITYPDFDPDTLCCPHAPDQPATAATREELMAKTRTPGHCSYIYRGKGKVSSSKVEEVLAYEKPSNHDGMYALFTDGHVEWIPEPQATRLFEELDSKSHPATQPAP